MCFNINIIYCGKNSCGENKAHIDMFKKSLLTLNSPDKDGFVPICRLIKNAEPLKIITKYFSHVALHELCHLFCL